MYLLDLGLLVLVVVIVVGEGEVWVEVERWWEWEEVVVEVVDGVYWSYFIACFLDFRLMWC